MSKYCNICKHINEETSNACCTCSHITYKGEELMIPTHFEAIPVEKRLCTNESCSRFHACREINLEPENCKDYKPAEKPPLGLTPRHIVDAARIREIFAAMNRYSDSNKSIPIEWIVELEEIVGRYLYGELEDYPLVDNK